MAKQTVHYSPVSSQPEVFVHGIRRAGVKHGAEDVQLRVRGVPVESGMIYFCPTRDYQVMSGNPGGDGQDISPSSRCVFDWPVGAPRAGLFDVLVRVVKNNGSLHLRVEEWQQNGRSVKELAPVTTLD